MPFVLPGPGQPTHAAQRTAVRRRRTPPQSIGSCARRPTWCGSACPTAARPVRNARPGRVCTTGAPRHAARVWRAVACKRSGATGGSIIITIIIITFIIMLNIMMCAAPWHARRTMSITAAVLRVVYACSDAASPPWGRRIKPDFGPASPTSGLRGSPSLLSEAAAACQSVLPRLDDRWIRESQAPVPPLGCCRGSPKVWHHANRPSARPTHPLSPPRRAWCAGWQLRVCRGCRCSSSPAWSA